MALLVACVAARDSIARSPAASCFPAVTICQTSSIVWCDDPTPALQPPRVVTAACERPSSGHTVTATHRGDGLTERRPGSTRHQKWIVPVDVTRGGRRQI